jgi:hypothetical protein
LSENIQVKEQMNVQSGERASVFSEAWGKEETENAVSHKPEASMQTRAGAAGGRAPGLC